MERQREKWDRDSVTERGRNTEIKLGSYIEAETDGDTYEGGE